MGYKQTLESILTYVFFKLVAFHISSPSSLLSTKKNVIHLKTSFFLKKVMIMSLILL